MRITWLQVAAVVPLSSGSIVAHAAPDAGTSNAAPQCENPDADEVEERELKAQTCSLYLAPSNLPNAGLGVFTGVDVEEGGAIGEFGSEEDDEMTFLQDLLVPILDKYKTIPYRGQERYMSWLGYIWSNEIDTFHHSYHDGTFPELSPAFYQVPEGLNGADEGLNFFAGEGYQRPLDAFAPGISSLVNSHPRRANIELFEETWDWDVRPDAQPNSKMEEEEGYNYDEIVDPNEASYSPHFGVSFVASEDIEAGSELYINYGREWHIRRAEKIAEGTETEYPTLEDAKESDIYHYPLPSEEDKRRQQLAMDHQTAPKRHSIDKVEAQRRLDVEDRLAEWRERQQQEQPQSTTPSKTNTTTKRSTATTSQEDNDSEDTTEDLPFEKDLEWLQTHGACLDNLKVGKSLITDTGRGAFSNSFIAKGSVIAPAPLLALKRKDLVMYKENKNAARYQNVIDLSEEVGTELLLNYCFGHPESDLLLVPYTPIVNFINHQEDASKVNAKIQWASEETSQTLLSRRPEDWLNKHPLDLINESGKLLMEFVATKDISPGDEVYISYGDAWQQAWEAHTASIEQDAVFRKEIGVPDGFFPSNWINQLMEYRVAPIEDLQPGEVVQLTWEHNGHPIARNAFVVGLPEGLTKHLKEFADNRGIISLYDQLLAEKVLDSDEWYVFDADQHIHEEEEAEQWFAQRYKSVDWDFNMHYIGPWNEASRKSILRAFGKGGFDVALEGIGNYFNLESLNCFHSSFMGVSEADRSFMHTDVYSTGEVGYNIIFPIITVNGSKPELDIQSDNADLVIAVKYEHDRAFVMSDWGYHKTSSVEYEDRGDIRVVLGMYCAQIDENNHRQMQYLYHGEDPAPFMSVPFETHWGQGHTLPK